MSTTRTNALRQFAALAQGVAITSGSMFCVEQYKDQGFKALFSPKAGLQAMRDHKVLYGVYAVSYAAYIGLTYLAYQSEIDQLYKKQKAVQVFLDRLEDVDSDFYEDEDDERYFDQVDWNRYFADFGYDTDKVGTNPATTHSWACDCEPCVKHYTKA